MLIQKIRKTDGNTDLYFEVTGRPVCISILFKNVSFIGYRKFTRSGQFKYVDLKLDSDDI